MEKDFLQGLEFAGFTARVKRLSDNLLYDARKVYQVNTMGIEPNWHLVFLLLKEEKKLSITDLAKSLDFSHPAVIKITKKMESKGFLESNTHPKDKRCQLLQLSKKGIEMLPFFEEKWDNFKVAISELVEEDFLIELTKLETRLKEVSFFDRCQESLQ